jgi:hypothetical protein
MFPIKKRASLQEVWVNLLRNLYTGLAMQADPWSKFTHTF